MMEMLLQVACVFLISTTSSLGCEDLVADVENSLNECLGIVEAVGRYMVHFHQLQEVRRSEDENGMHDTDVKLGACVSIVEAVDAYHASHSRLELYQNFLTLEEWAYLNQLLMPLSEKVGNLLYVASTDGDAISDFRRACGSQTPTLTIFESDNGSVFGGYTDWDMSVDTGGHTAASAFIFRLRPSFEQYHLIYPSVAIAISDYGLYYGNAINIAKHPLSQKSSVSGAHYSVDGFELNDGEQVFQMREFIAVKVEEL